MTIHIFGDSYAHDIDRGTSFKQWLDMVEDKEDVVNHARASASPYYCFRALKRESSNLDEFDKIIFLLTDPTRLDFPFLKAPDHTSSTYNLWQRNEFNNENELYLKDWDYEIRLVFDMLEPEIMNFYFYVISGLNFISHKIGCKILALPVIDFTIKEGTLNYFDPFFYNNDQFKVANVDLFRVSNEEFVDCKFNQEVELKRRNHLSENNHTVLYNIISNFFYNTDYNEKFHTELYDVEGERLDRFIYA